MLTRAAEGADREFIVEMARLAASLEGSHPVPEAGAAVVRATLPGPEDVAVVALAGGGELVGAAWCHVHDPPLLVDERSGPLPEVVMAVVPDHRGRGIGSALLERVADRAAGPALSLNVHLLNPAVRLYIRAGFRVAGAGRGWYGVAMRRDLV